MERRRKRKKKPKLKLLHIIAILFIFWLSKTLISQSLMLKELKNKKVMEEEAISQLEGEIEELKEEIENKDSLSFIEKTAREDLKMIKPGEIMYIDKNKEKGILKFFRK
ncbi:septum formation initiator family protein [Tepidimicrobium xylanilyticum]|uniref:Cell division protein FtsB n=1 Tax=Tepidimicrobium xylanilyticum TaxID=1123352 RepID=A0A1H2XS86_9FIRM|nr:septum formation initiator family protein [Tepidimicrobium xylanilyticum]GMG97568.1 hypothetical protein EN5CB1_23940 [Tepidimicrobium xylanilyticum]SDW95354.1 Cell division protein FtsB [Tepidimicrobium xylanilyticum]